MNKRIAFLLSLSLFVVFQSCQSDGAGAAATGEGYVFTGKTSNFPASTKVFLDLVDGPNVSVIDTASLEADGTFKLSGKIDGKNLGRLRILNNNYLIVLQNSDLHIEVDRTNHLAYKMTGDPEAVQMDQLVRDIRSRKLQGSSLAKYADTTKSTLISYLAVHHLPIEEKLESYEKLVTRMKSSMPGSALTTDLSNRVSTAKKTQLVRVGGPAPDINLAGLNGANIPLSSLKGKVVLIDFWASWCKPCRRENPNVVKVYKEYKNKGFEVYSVSLDKTKPAWERAVKQDNLIWDSHVSDLAGWKSSAAAMYGVRSIPQTFLIDQDGKIVAKNLRGQELERKLSEIFS